MKLKRVLPAVIVVELLPSTPKCDLIQLPDIAEGNKIGPTNAIVHQVGEKSSYKDVIHAGDVVIVPAQFGTRITVEDKKLVVYDDEDVIAKLEN